MIDVSHVGFMESYTQDLSYCDSVDLRSFNIGDIFGLPRNTMDNLLDSIDLTTEEFDLLPNISELENVIYSRTGGALDMETNLCLTSTNGPPDSEGSEEVGSDVDISEPGDVSMDDPMNGSDSSSEVFTVGPRHGLHPDLIYKQDEEGDTVLHTAIIVLNTTIAMKCIESATSVDMLSIKNKLKQSPLHLAVLTNQVSLVRKLLVGGADITSRDLHGNSPLLLACKQNNLDAVKALLEPVRHDEQGNVPYEPPHHRVKHYLEVKNYSGLTSLHLAALHGAGPIVELLIGKGADVNAIDGKTGRTVLHSACVSGDVELVRCLLKLDTCDFNARTFDDYTPFDLARIRRHDEIQILLARAGAGTDFPDH